MNIKRLVNLLSESEHGYFTTGGQYLVGNEQGFTRKISVTNNTASIDFEFRNETDEEVALNSIVIADFIITKEPIKILENAWTQSGFSGYTNGIRSTKRKWLFLVRDQNPYSFRDDFGYLKNSQVSEWYMQMVFKDLSLVVGATTIQNQYVQIFVKKMENDVRIRVTCQLDGKKILPGETIKSEKILFILGSVKKTLNQFADLVRKENRVDQLQKPIKGLCCAYYYQGNYVDEKYILDQLKVIDNFNKKLFFDVIQIDGLPTPWGDWEESWNKLFPSGLDFIVNEIKKRNMRAGFWIAPFVASPNSNLFLNHKDWFLKDENDNFFESRFTSPFDFMPSLSFRALDPTHPEVQNHIAEIIRNMVACGFSYIKTDFSYPIGFTSNFWANTTRAEALRTGFDVIKKAAGENVSVQSCISQISPLIGVVDYVRTGLDTLNPFAVNFPIINKFINRFMVKENLRNCEARSFLNNKVIIEDPDCVVLRPGTGLDRKLIERHKRFIVQNSTSLWIGDNLCKLADADLNEIHNFLKI